MAVKKTVKRRVKKTAIINKEPKKELNLDIKIDSDKNLYPEVLDSFNKSGMPEEVREYISPRLSKYIISGIHGFTFRHSKFGDYDIRSTISIFPNTDHQMVMVEWQKVKHIKNEYERLGTTLAQVNAEDRFK